MQQPPKMKETTIRVGLLGCGTVGSSLVELLAVRGDDIASRTGLRFEIGPVAIRSLDKPRPSAIEGHKFTTDPELVVSDPEVDVVIELIGGTDPARHLVATALKNGKPVVTGNKALLATAGSELFAIADEAGVDLLFEAAVAGGIPFIRPLRESLAGEHLIRVMGILNGTTNYILTRMTEEGVEYGEVLADAQALGYAESDPTADVEGHDAAAKAAIIASLAYGTNVTLDDVPCEGITSITQADIEPATKLGYVIKLLAIIESVVGGIAVRVHPVMVPATHPLASVREAHNAIFVEGDSVGDLMFYGQGAGGQPTASAVLGDLIDASLNLRKGAHATISSQHQWPVVPLAELTSAFYLNVDVLDEPGVLAQVAGVLGDHGVSVQSMEQIGMGHEARLAFITHRARESDLDATLRDLEQLDAVGAINSVLRVLAE